MRPITKCLNAQEIQEGRQDENRIKSNRGRRTRGKLKLKMSRERGRVKDSKAKYKVSDEVSQRRPKD